MLANNLGAQRPCTLTTTNLLLKNKEFFEAGCRFTHLPEMLAAKEIVSSIRAELGTPMGGNSAENTCRRTARSTECAKKRAWLAPLPFPGRRAGHLLVAQHQSEKRELHAISHRSGYHPAARQRAFTTAIHHPQNASRAEGTAATQHQ